MPSFRALATGAAGLLILSACKSGVECDPVDPLCGTGGIPSLSIANVAAAEDGGDAVFNVTLSGSASLAVTVSYTTVDGSATAPRDYQVSAGSLSFPPGTTMRQITVPLWPDVYNEGADETFRVALSAPTGATIASGVGTGTIIEDDACVPTGTIAVGETVANDLEGTGCFFPGGEYLDMYLLTLSAATDLLIDQTSDDVDSELFLMETDGATVDSDDSSGFDMNARIDLTNVPTGEYLVIASSVNAAEVGGYEVSINREFYATTSGRTIDSELVSIDAATGAAVAIGPIGFNRVSAIDFHPTTGVLYGVGREPAPGDTLPQLITINTTTGVGTLVGPLGIAVNATNANITGMSFREDGALFLYQKRGTSDSIYTANVTTGVATLVGPTLTNGFAGNALAFDGSGTLHHADISNYHTIDTSTGTATLGAEASFPAVECPLDGRVTGFDLLSGTDRSFYGVAKCEGAGPAPGFFGRIDPATGVMTFIGPSTLMDLDGFAIW